MATDENLPVSGQDFENPKKKSEEKPSSHGEVANQRDGDFSELEESRMDNPPKHREENGANKEDVDSSTDIDQQDGI